jgi:twitching motility protein PilT
MNKPIYEIPVGDGERIPAAGAGRRSSTGASAPPPIPPAPQMSAPPMASPQFPAPSMPPPSLQSTPRESTMPPPQMPAPSVVPGLPAFGGPPAAPSAFAAPPVPVLSDQSPSVGVGQAGSDPDLVSALNAVVSSKASDLHVSVNTTPVIRVDGGLKPVAGAGVWDANKVQSALFSIMTQHHREIFAEHLELDFAYTLSETARFRVNVYMQRNVMGAAFRLIPTEIKQLAALGIPEKIAKFAQLPRGLVLVTGPTGSGKSTTLAALIDLVNSTRADHIVTVEDPIEFLHTNKRSLVNQREVGHDTHSFAAALKHVLRQDPDVILIGELRDLETISVALTAAETGHLVFATLHTQDAAQTIDRVIDVFPPHQQGQIRAQLAATLQGVVCQTLVKRVGGIGRAVATEVLVTTPAVSNLIREGKTYQLPSTMQAGRDVGMHTMDQHLADLVNAGQISHQSAYEKAHDLEDLKQLIQRAGTVNAQAGSQNSRSASGIDFGDTFSVKGV